uniref:Putative secreted protein n=1 Tax=Ixodes ricinus TaxID=34613 RepID=A0A6B0V029_IXORI
MKSCGSLKLAKPKPLLLLVRLSRTTLALRNDGNLPNTLIKTSSVTSLPRSPQKMRKSSASHSWSELSSHTCWPAVLTSLFSFLRFLTPLPSSDESDEAAADLSPPLANLSEFLDLSDGFCFSAPLWWDDCFDLDLDSLEASAFSVVGGIMAGTATTGATGTAGRGAAMAGGMAAPAGTLLNGGAE